MPSNGNVVINNGASWSATSDEDFFFKVYFASNPTPTEEIVDAGFASGNYRGAIINDDDELTTDIKFLNAVLIDDTLSMSWSDPFAGTGSELKESFPDFLASLYNRTEQSIDDGSGPRIYETSYTDYWVYSSKEINRSSGFINSIDDITTYSSALFQRGILSSLLGTAPIVVNGLNFQSVIDAILKSDDTAGNITRINDLVLYLDSINCLRLQDIIDYWDGLPEGTRSEWGDPAGGNYLSSSISNYTDVSEYLVTRWAKTFTSFAMIVADGDNVSDDSVTNTVLAANSSWNDLGSPVHTFGLGKSHKEDFLRQMSAGTSGRHFHISESGDWTSAVNTLKHGGEYSIFKSTWNKKFDYLNPTWISVISATYDSADVSTGKRILLKARWTFDRVNFTPWVIIQSGSDFILREEVLALEYDIELYDGWDSGASQVDRPVIQSLTHTVVTPSIQYIFTPLQPINGMMFETMLSAAAFLPVNARATWGICRGNSNDFVDYDLVHTSRKSALPNRQRGVLFTDASVDSRLSTVPDSTLTTFSVIKNNRTRTWLSSDEILVEILGVNNTFSAVTSNFYTTIPSQGLVIFNPALRPTSAGTNPTVLVTITTPSTSYISKGESTSTLDYRTYTLVNGRWPDDALAIVLKNQQIVRGGYWLNAEEGTVTFNKELETTDLVTVYIEHSNFYRVGVEIYNFETNVSLDFRNFSLFYTKLYNPSLLAEYNQTNAPVVSNVRMLPVNIDSNNNLINPTIYQRLSVDYHFTSANNADESGTAIAWWRYRTGFAGSGTSQIVDGEKYFPITSYNDRITQKKVDVGLGVTFAQGDKFFVEVQPSDGISLGRKVKSNIIELDGDKVPYIFSGIGSSEFIYIDANTLEIDPTTGLRSALAKDSLRAVYQYHNPDNTPDTFPDNTLVEWYLDSSGGVGSTSGIGSTATFTGKTVDINLTSSGEVYIFKATPYNGQRYGRPVWSTTIYIR